jgi:hypothetical protein
VKAICADCGVDTVDIGEYYMLHDEVWSATGMPTKPDLRSYLCVGCVEGRVGRILSRADFTDAPLNTTWPPANRSGRLINRLVRGGHDHEGAVQRRWVPVGRVAELDPLALRPYAPRSWHDPSSPDEVGDSAVIMAYISSSAETKAACGMCSRSHSLRRIRFSTDGHDSICPRCAAAHDPVLSVIAERLIEATFEAITERRYPHDRIMRIPLPPPEDETHPVPVSMAQMAAACDYLDATRKSQPIGA